MAGEIRVYDKDKNFIDMMANIREEILLIYNQHTERRITIKNGHVESIDVWTNDDAKELCERYLAIVQEYDRGR